MAPHRFGTAPQYASDRPKHTAQKAADTAAPLYEGWNAIDRTDAVVTAARLADVVLHERVQNLECSISVMTSNFIRSTLGSAPKMKDHSRGHLRIFELDPLTL
jgi:hypothetical protein